MTAKCALAMALLEGRVLNVKNVFETIGLTNCSREISRMIEQPFGVQVSRTRREGKSRYGQPVNWTDYRLNKSEHNKEGIEKMRTYIHEQLTKMPAPKTDREAKQAKIYQQQQMFINT